MDLCQTEVALGLLVGLGGRQIATTYMVFGLAIAVVAGFVIGKLHLEGWLQDWVQDIQSGSALQNDPEDEKLTLPDRYRLGIGAVHEILQRSGSGSSQALRWAR